MHRSRVGKRPDTIPLLCAVLWLLIVEPKVILKEIP